MSHSKSHYYRSRLLKERIRKDEASHRPQAATKGRASPSEVFTLPDYFNVLPTGSDVLNGDQGRYPRVVLWDENI